MHPNFTQLKSDWNSNFPNSTWWMSQLCGWFWTSRPQAIKFSRVFDFIKYFEHSLHLRKIAIQLHAESADTRCFKWKLDCLPSRDVFGTLVEPSQNASVTQVPNYNMKPTETLGPVHTNWMQLSCKHFVRFHEQNLKWLLRHSLSRDTRGQSNQLSTALLNLFLENF